LLKTLESTSCLVTSSLVSKTLQYCWMFFFLALYASSKELMPLILCLVTMISLTG
jgi:hypothetical protein